MHCIRSHLLSSRDHGLYVEVGCEGVVAGDEGPLVCQPDRQSESVLTSMHHHSLDSQRTQRAKYSECDFAAIRNQYAAEHGKRSGSRRMSNAESHQYTSRRYRFSVFIRPLSTNSLASSSDIPPYSEQIPIRVEWTSLAM